MFLNEDEFQAYFIEHFGRTYLGNWLYAKITSIGGEFIQPEIDLLDISPIAPGQIVSAFEFKVLNSSKMGNNYSRIYAGIGQAVSYFQYGVDQSYLIIGISDNIPSESSSSLRGNIRLIGDWVSQLHANRFGMKMYDELLNEIWDIPFLSPSGRFERTGIHRDFVQPIELARDNILAGNFAKRKGNNFFRKYRLNQYVPVTNIRA